MNHYASKYLPLLFAQGHSRLDSRLGTSHAELTPFRNRPPLLPPELRRGPQYDRFYPWARQTRESSLLKFTRGLVCRQLYQLSASGVRSGSHIGTTQNSIVEVLPF